MRFLTRHAPTRDFDVPCTNCQKMVVVTFSSATKDFVFRGASCWNCGVLYHKLFTLSDGKLAPVLTALLSPPVNPHTGNPTSSGIYTVTDHRAPAKLLDDLPGVMGYKAVPRPLRVQLQDSITVKFSAKDRQKLGDIHRRLDMTKDLPSFMVQSAAADTMQEDDFKDVWFGGPLTLVPKV